MGWLYPCHHTVPRRPPAPSPRPNAGTCRIPVRSCPFRPWLNPLFSLSDRPATPLVTPAAARRRRCTNSERRLPPTAGCRAVDRRSSAGGTPASACPPRRRGTQVVQVLVTVAEDFAKQYVVYIHQEDVELPEPAQRANPVRPPDRQIVRVEMSERQSVSLYDLIEQVVPEADLGRHRVGHVDVVRLARQSAGEDR
jgi:hypothetical protein